MGNGNQVFHRNCSFFDPKHLKNYRFGGIFLKFHTFTQITFKTIDFVALFFVGRVGRVGSVGGFWIRKKSKNSTRIYHFDTRFESTILVTVNFKWESLASLATNKIITTKAHSLVYRLVRLRISRGYDHDCVLINLKKKANR